LELDAAMATDPVDQALLVRPLQLALQTNDPERIAVTLLLLGSHPEPPLPDALTAARQNAAPDVQTKIGHALFLLAKELRHLEVYTPRILSSSLYAEAERDAYKADLLREITEKGLSLPPDVIIDNATRLRRRKVLDGILEHAENDELEAIENELKKRTIGPSELAVSSRILRVTGSKSLTEHVGREILSLSEGHWHKVNGSFHASNEVAETVLWLLQEGALGSEHASHLGKVLIDLLKEQLSSEARQTPRLLRQLSVLESLLSRDQLESLAAVTYNAALRGRVTLKAWFFNQYGALLAASTGIRRSGGEVIDKIYVPIVERRHTPVLGLEWLAAVLRQEADLLLTKGKRHRTRFRRAIATRLKGKLKPRQKAALNDLQALVDRSLGR
jgi:hypothetical protein